MKKWFREIVEYLKDNPEGYWFKAKLYGYGWTPATREGWLVTLGVIGFIVWNAARFESGNYQENEIFIQVIAPTFAAIAILITVCILKGEKPRWTWGESVRGTDARGSQLREKRQPKQLQSEAPKKNNSEEEKENEKTRVFTRVNEPNR